MTIDVENVVFKQTLTSILFSCNTQSQFSPEIFCNTQYFLPIIIASIAIQTYIQLLVMGRTMFEVRCSIVQSQK